MLTAEEQLAELKRGTAEILLESELLTKLRAGSRCASRRVSTRRRRTCISATRCCINKMRHFQEFGHEVIFLIGDFTGLIGDPTGRNATRPALTPRGNRGERRNVPAADLQDPRPAKDAHRFQFALDGRDERGRADPARRQAHGGAHARARRFRQALQGRAADRNPRVPVSARAGLRLGGAQGRRRARRHRPEIQSAGRPPAAGSATARSRRS